MRKSARSQIFWQPSFLIRKLGKFFDALRFNKFSQTRTTDNLSPISSFHPKIHNQKDSQLIDKNGVIWLNILRSSTSSVILSRLLKCRRISRKLYLEDNVHLQITLLTQAYLCPPVTRATGFWTPQSAMCTVWHFKGRICKPVTGCSPGDSPVSVTVLTLNERSLNCCAQRADRILHRLIRRS